MSAESILRKWSRRAGAFVALAFFSTSAFAVSNPPLSCPSGQSVRNVVDASSTSGFSPALAVKCVIGSSPGFGAFDLACGYAAGSPAPNQGTVPTVWNPAVFTAWTQDASGWRISFTQTNRLASNGATLANQVTALLRATCGTCPPGSNSVNGICQTPAQEANCPAAGTVRVRGRLAGFRGQSVGCHNGCLVNRTQAAQPSFGVSKVAGDGTIYVEGSTGTEWLATGETCAIDDPQLSTTEATWTNGPNNAVLQTQGDNCGVFNGESICLGAGPPASSCVTTAGGQSFCSQTAASPPVPARAGTGTNGVPPQPAEPVGVISITNNAGETTVYNYYNAQASQQPAQGGTTTGGTGGTGIGGTTSGGTGGTTGGLCGLPGQALCGVDVDETDVPSMAPEDLFPDGTAEADAKAAATAVNQGIAADAADRTNAASSGLFDMLAGMVGGAPGVNQCLTVPYGFTAPPPWNVQVSGQFPTEQGCQLFQLARVAFSWLLAGFTVLSSVRRVRAAFLGAPL